MALLVDVIYVLGLTYFGPMLAFGRTHARGNGEVTPRGFMQFLQTRVEIRTGPVSSKALIQIALIPIALGWVVCPSRNSWAEITAS